MTGKEALLALTVAFVMVSVFLLSLRAKRGNLVVRNQRPSALPARRPFAQGSGIAASLGLLAMTVAFVMARVLLMSFRAKRGNLVVRNQRRSALPARRPLAQATGLPRR